MLFPLGFQELLVILVILVFIFGASRLPALGRSVGETIRSFKQGMREGIDEPPPAEKK
jgi:sec-independent protein translocase protein TatA